MKLPIASKYILSEVNDYLYLCCFCNSFTTQIKYITNKLEEFYSSECDYCSYLGDECDGGVSELRYGNCLKYKYSDFDEELFITVNVPNHVYIEKYDDLRHDESYLMILDNGKFKPLMLPNIYDYGKICFDESYANTPALRYSNYWNSEFNDDLTHESLVEDKDELQKYLSSWSIDIQEDVYGENSYSLNEYINEDKYIETDTATDIIFARDCCSGKKYIGLGTNTHNKLEIQYL